MNRFIEQIRWEPGIGDPTVMGWLTVVAYFVTFVLGLFVVMRSDWLFQGRRDKQKRLWMLITVAMLFLGFNKQLDLQSLFTDIFRVLFREADLYDNRRSFQKLFILSVLLGGVAATTWLLYQYRKLLRYHVLAISGLCALAIFIVVRASSFHGMDRLIGFELLGVRINWILELGGIALIAVNAFRLLARQTPIVIRKHRRRRKRRGPEHMALAQQIQRANSESLR
ncbi:hypothetical protein [Microbulbifer aggregans]|uniref:hypothetical protein n=1 Tax=Microbulbifer aggregans TaxID=1769779 RepID=UPI001CFCDED1|nr:hypothetical protein [Microbulbifer aggregans]